MNAFIDAYKDMWRRYAQFDGRASVGGFWRAWAINFAVLIGFGILIGIFTAAEIGPLVAIVAVAFVVYYLAVLVPSLAISVRRLHDSDKSGWMYLVGFIPFVGGIILLVFFVSAGTPGVNQYGPQPIGTQWTTDGFLPGGAYVGQVPPGAPGAPGGPDVPPPPPPANY